MKDDELILAVDVGGTKTIMTLFHENNCDLVEIETERFPSGDFDSLEDIIKEFLKAYDQTPKSASFGIPGPVENGVVKSTNLPWLIKEKDLSKTTGIPTIHLMNDLVATAYSVPLLTGDELVNIKKGTKKEHPERYVVIAPGTGLGQSFLIHSEGSTVVIPSEGGHASFAPTSEIETELFLYLLKKFGHVSYERIISGSGLPNIYEFFVESKKMKPKKETIEKMENEDPAKVITEMALRKEDPVCGKTLDLFVSVLGAHAGDLALSFLAYGGVYLGGGIPHKILPKLKEALFVRSFEDKGRMKDVVEQIPINVITNNLAALKGAAFVAQENCKLSR
jgi:glucokinase